LKDAPTLTNDLLIVIPTYNERQNIGNLLPRLWQSVPQADVLIVDDDSPDGTGHWCRQLGQREPRLHCLHRQHRTGIGAATVAGLQWGLQRHYDWIGTLDGDGSHDPAPLQKIVAILDETPVDVWIGSRYCPGGEIAHWPWHRRLASQMVNRISNRVLRLPVGDVSGAYRLYHRSILAKADLDSLQSTGYAYLQELLLKLVQADARIREFPIRFDNRQQGKSKAGPRQAARAMADLFRLFIRRN